MPRRSRYQCVDPNHPEAAAECDRGGEVRRRSELIKEMEWRGDRLQWNGLLVCRDHIDPPQPQDRTMILPPDPVPVENPRPRRRMIPLPGLLTDGTPTESTTASVLTDEHNRPLYDGTGRFQWAERFGTKFPGDDPRFVVTDLSGAPMTDALDQPLLATLPNDLSSLFPED